MLNLLPLRIAAREIFDEALRAVDPGAAESRALRLDGFRLDVCETRFDLARNSQVFSIAIGKAALPMAIALEEVLGELLAEGLIAGPIAGQTRRGSAAMPPEKLSTRWHWCEGGHPLPTRASLTAASEAFRLIERANEERGPVIFLVSGGGSAMMEWPISDDITLADLRMANKALVSCGASIGEINSVRRAFSAVKGGQLAARAPNCQQVTLIVSDVPRGEERNVASGPTLSAPPNAPNAIEVVERYDLREKLPSSIMRAIDRSASTIELPLKEQQYFVLLENDTALEAAANAAQRRGLFAEIAQDISDESIETGCEKLLTRASELRDPSGQANDICLLSGGEFTCPVRGPGIGGRNLETALRLAIASAENPERIGEFVALCAGTDGIDGNSPAAGALVDSTTIDRARAIGLDPTDFLNRSDAYSFFVALGDAITTGPTGTNVRDIRILIRNAGK
jgi:hydroxypyruvate reductase